MPPRKAKAATKKRTEEEENEEILSSVDVKYNPDIVVGLLKDLKRNVDTECEKLRCETGFLITSMEQAFHLEMIKLPSNVKKMSMKQFREEFNFNLDEVTRKMMLGTAVPKPTSVPRGVFETPAANRRGPLTVMQTPMTAARQPREGEVILSSNGSPLGEFSTVKKAPRADKTAIVPPTPGIFVPLKTGEIVDLDDLDIENLPEEARVDTLKQMENMMQNMKATLSTILRKCSAKGCSLQLTKKCISKNRHLDLIRIVHAPPS